MKEYDVYLFDWDGCLAMTLEVWLHGFRETFREFGLAPTDEEIIHHFGNVRGPLELGASDLDEYMERLMARVGQDLKTVDMYSGAKEVLETIKQNGKPIALISSSPGGVLHAALEHNKLNHFFDAVFSADDVPKHKPDPLVIYEALSKLGKSEAISNTVIIGDSKSDLGAANNAKIDAVLMYPKSHEAFYSLDALKSFEPTYIFEDFGQFKAQLRVA